MTYSLAVIHDSKTPIKEILDLYIPSKLTSYDENGWFQAVLSVKNDTEKVRESLVKNLITSLDEYKINSLKKTWREIPEKIKSGDEKESGIAEMLLTEYVNEENFILRASIGYPMAFITKDGKFVSKDDSDESPKYYYEYLETIKESNPDDVVTVVTAYN